MIRFRLAVGAGTVLITSFLWFGLTRRNHPPAPGIPQNDARKVGFRVGEYAPDFELRSVDGQSFKLSAFRGEPVVVNFWGTWCAPCKVEIPWLVQLDQSYRNDGVKIVGVAMESGSAEDIARFAQERGMKYLIVIGNSATADGYGGVRFMPQSFFIGKDGRIARETIGLTDKKDLEDGIKALIEGNSKPQVAQGERP